MSGPKTRNRTTKENHPDPSRTRNQSTTTTKRPAKGRNKGCDRRKGSRKTPEGFTGGEVPEPGRATVRQPRSPATPTPHATAPVAHQPGPNNNLTCHLGSP